MDEHTRGAHHVHRVGRSQLFVEPPVRFQGPAVIRSDTRIGCFTQLAQQSELQAADVGRYCEIGPNTTLGATGHPVSWLGVSAFQYKEAAFGWHPAAAEAEVIDPEAGGRQSFRSIGPDHASIGHDVWLGAGVVVLRGVTIGHGCIVAANAVVTKDLPPYTISGGLPAKVIRPRVPDGLRDELLDLQWWRYAPRELSGLPYDDPPAAVPQLRSRIESGLEPYDPGFVEIPPDPQRDTGRTRRRRFR